MNLRQPYAILVMMCYAALTYGQGCSDSGFCTMGAFKPDQPYLKKFNVRLNSVELTQHLGHTKYGDWIHATFLDATVGFSNRTSLQVRLPSYAIIVGNMPTTKGWGDLFLNVSHAVVVRENYRLSITAGAKIYTSRPDKKSEEGIAMPLYQQTTVGSNDLSIGGSLITRKWLFAVGYQHALNRTKNNFNHEDWQGHELENVVVVYDPSAGLERGDDIMARVERNFRLSRFNFYLGGLGLFRIKADKTLNQSGELAKVAGSTGLALNAVTGAGYQFNTRMGIRLLLAFKVKEREANPDGLSRDFVSQVAYIVRF